MSTNYQNPMVPDVEADVTLASMPPVPPMEEPVQPEAEAPVKKNGGYRIFAAILAILSIAAFFIPMLGVLNATYGVESKMLFEALTSAFSSNSKAFGILPVLTNDTLLGSLSGLMVYVLVLTLAISFLTSFIGIFSKKKAPCLLYTAAASFGIGTMLYTASIMMATASTGKLAFDLISLALAVVGLILCCVLSLIKEGKKAWASILQFVLTLVAGFILVFGAAKADKDLINAFTANAMYKTLTLVVVAIVILDVICAYIRVKASKGLAFDIVRYSLLLIAALVLCYVNIAGKVSNNTIQSFALISAVLSLVQIVIAVIQVRSKGKEEVVEAREELNRTFAIEEYAEAYPYEGGPVAGVEMAEEVNPTFVPHPPHVNTAGYDFYNCKSFDPFIAMLDAEERNQFTEIFILKFKGVMPELPNYEVGGDNKEFFRKVFIYLGQYRDRIPNGLLAKMYQFSIKLV